MSVSDQLTNLRTNISNAYTTISDKGGTVPTNKNTQNLASAIDSIPSGGGGGITPEFLGCESQAEAEYLENIMSENILTLTYKGELQWA